MIVGYREINRENVGLEHAAASPVVEAHAPPSHAGTALTDAGAQVLPKHPNLQMQHTSWSAATIDTAAARRRAPEGLGGDTGGGSCSSMSGSQAHDARARFVIERQRRLVTQSSELVHFYRALIRRCRRLVTAPAFQFLLLGTALWCWNYYAMVPIFRALLPMRGAVFFPYLGIWTGACAALLLPCALLAAALPFCSRPGTRRLAVWTAFGSCGLLGLVLARHIAAYAAAGPADSMLGWEEAKLVLPCAYHGCSEWFK